jgi:hypothetical protein
VSAPNVLEVDASLALLGWSEWDRNVRIVRLLGLGDADLATQLAAVSELRGESL